MKNRLLILFAFLSSFVSVSQNVTIKGTAKTYEYKDIGLWVNADYISNTQKQLTYSTIDSAGIFLLELNTKEIQYITLKIEKFISSMYIEPGRNYEIIISPPDSTTYENPNLEHDVKISINLKSRTEINALTMDYEKRFDDFLTKDYISFLKRTPQIKIDSFLNASHEYYSTVINPYFKGYITYSVAALEEKTKVSEKKLFAKYLDKKPILYNNPEYMNFFNSFYKQKIQNFALSTQGLPLNYQMNDRGNLSGTMNILKRDEFMKNDTIAELVLMKGLYESYYDKSFKQESILAVLQQVMKESRIEEHKHIAQNILNSFSHLQKGSNAPAFELADKSSNTQSLDELKNKKYVYLMFFDSDCSSCLQQMKVVAAFKKKYGEKINFVSISTDKITADFKNFCQKNPKYDWIFLYDNTNGKLKTDYEIKELPAYFLINPDGKFVQVPAESPDGDIDRAFYDITKPKVKLHNVGQKHDN